MAITDFEQYYKAGFWLSTFGFDLTVANKTEAENH